MKKILFFVVWLFFVFPLLSEVVNPDKPLKGVWDLKARKVWEITEIGGNPIVSPIITVSDDEIVYIYDEKFALNYILDKNGKLKATFGKKGQGPGEVAREGLIFAVKDKLVIYDYPAKLHYFSNNGEYIKTHSISIGIIPYYFINENEYISAPPPVRENVQIKYVNLHTGKKRIIKDILYEARVTRSGMIAAIPGFTKMLQLSFDPQNKRVYYGMDDSYQINMIDLDGNMINRFSLQRQQPKISNDLKKKIIYNYFRGSRVEHESEAAVKHLSNELTYFNRIWIEDGRVFIFLNNIVTHWKSQPIDIFSLDGKYLYHSIFTPGEGESISNSLSFGDVLCLKKGHLYVILEDMEGERKIAKYEISLPK
ncbi:MAG: hypothetical protein JSV88_17510 [Candidatus Aminicenantes bacterium]|nr:MAG: hypothetical protein JSV88_17510 [Candidatus Aminicenantes bacterium]